MSLATFLSVNQIGRTQHSIKTFSMTPSLFSKMIRKVLLTQLGPNACVLRESRTKSRGMIFRSHGSGYGRLTFPSESEIDTVPAFLGESSSEGLTGQH